MVCVRVVGSHWTLVISLADLFFLLLSDYNTFWVREFIGFLRQEKS